VKDELTLRPDTRGRQRLLTSSPALVATYFGMTSSSGLFSLRGYGGRTRTRTLDPLIKSLRLLIIDQCLGFRADLVYLRAWRKAVQQASGAGMIALFTVLLGGIAGALWLGVKTLMAR
jgi:hypothetical protein